MKYKWLNKNNSLKLIVFFNGWGMDENIVSHLNFDEFDVLMFYDYNTLETDFDFTILSVYHSAHLVAWSMGVMIATLFQDIYATKTAINGTLKPIDNRYGIPEKIYNLTIRGFSPASAKKFVQNMFMDDFHCIKINRDFENQKSELKAILNYGANLNFMYTRILISDNDKIIPTKNQSAFWNLLPNISGGHAIFHKFNSWSELL